MRKPALTYKARASTGNGYQCPPVFHVRTLARIDDLLGAEGKKEAAIRLEQLWNSLADTHTFSLHCAYPINGFSRGDYSEPFLKICAEHTSVLPTESYLSLIEEEERRRAVAHLQ